VFELMSRVGRPGCGKSGNASESVC
jgi:hypothetical protein